MLLYGNPKGRLGLYTGSGSLGGPFPRALPRGAAKHKVVTLHVAPPVVQFLAKDPAVADYDLSHLRPGPIPSARQRTAVVGRLWGNRAPPGRAAFGPARTPTHSSAHFAARLYRGGKSRPPVQAVNTRPWKIFWYEFGCEKRHGLLLGGGSADLMAPHPPYHFLADASRRPRACEVLFSLVGGGGRAGCGWGAAGETSCPARPRWGRSWRRPVCGQGGVCPRRRGGGLEAVRIGLEIFAEQHPARFSHRLGGGCQFFTHLFQGFSPFFLRRHQTVLVWRSFLICGLKIHTPQIP